MSSVKTTGIICNNCFYETNCNGLKDFENKKLHKQIKYCVGLKVITDLTNNCNV